MLVQHKKKHELYQTFLLSHSYQYMRAKDLFPNIKHRNKVHVEILTKKVATEDIF